MAIGLRELADMEISCAKTECLFIQEQVSVETTHLFEESNAEAKQKILTHRCEACVRGFSCYQGLQTHESIWCGWAEKLDKEKDREIKEVIIKTHVVLTTLPISHPQRSSSPMTFYREEKRECNE